jgi:phosphomannomutase/phosphoglucomutase
MNRATSSGNTPATLWQRWRYVMVVVVLLTAIVGVGWHVYLEISEQAGQEQREKTDSTAIGTAAALSHTLNERFARYRRLSTDPAVVDAFASGDQARLRQLGDRFAAAEPEVRGVRMVPLGTREVDYSFSPPLTYASLELLEDSEQTGETPLPEVQLSESKEGHIAVVGRVTGPDGRLLGHALVGVDPSMLQKVVTASAPATGYVELRQPVAGAKPVILARQGDASLAGGSAISRKIEGTGWLMYYVPAVRGARGALPLEGPWLWAGLALVVVLAAAVLVWALPRRRPTIGEAPAGAPARASARARVEAQPPPREAPPGESDEAAAPAVPEGELTQVPLSIFRAYDIRGVVGETLTPDLAEVIGQAIGSEAERLGLPMVCVGRDTRSSSEALSEALCEGLAESGLEVIDLGRVPTPILNYATHYLETRSGVMVTGSHNPPEYNGFKVVLGGEALSGDAIRSLRGRIESGELVTGMGVVRAMDITAEYIRELTEDIPVALGNPFKLVIDCGNGAAGELAPRLFRALGHDVVELDCGMSGDFSRHDPDPSQPENLQELIHAVQKGKADLGIAFDGDGDRLAVVDDKGQIIWPDRLLMLYARDVLARNPGTKVVYDVKCSARLGQYIREQGGEPVMWHTGYPLIRARMKQEGALLAGEMSGHIFVGDRWYGIDDALYAAARLLEILRDTGGAPSKVFAALPGGVCTPELRVPMAEGEPQRFMERFAAEARFAGAEVTVIDGVRADFPEGWGLVRASNTTPNLVMRFEGDNPGALARIQDVFRQAVLTVERGLSLPF